jgi:GBP family porin
MPLQTLQKKLVMLHANLNAPVPRLPAHPALAHLGVLAALVLGSSISHAQSSVTIYGIADAGVGALHNGSTRSTRLLSGVANGSRLGFRGQEDLGGGLSANFVLEQGMSLSNGALTQGGLAFGRQSHVGVSSAQGWSVSAGRQFSPLTLSMISVDPFGWQYFGNTLGTGIGLHESPGEGPGSGGFQATGRVNNSMFGTFKSGSFAVAGMAAFGDEDARGSGRMLGASSTYSDGSLLVTGAFSRFRQYAGAITPTATPQWQSQFLAGASYDFKVLKVSAGYYAFKPENAGRTPGAPNGLDPRFDRSATAWIGARMPLGLGALLVNVMRSKYEYSSNADGKGTSVGVAYEHLLSKRTALYASYGQVNNSGSGLMPLFAAIPAVIPGAQGEDLKGYALGIRHAF